MSDTIDAALSPQNSTPEGKVFEPTKGMIKWFEAALELGHTATITSIAEKAELDRSNWYQWLEIAGFVEWWDGQWQQYLKVNRWKLDAMGMKQAERNYDYWRSMMERVGNLDGASTSDSMELKDGNRSITFKVSRGE